MLIFCLFIELTIIFVSHQKTLPLTLWRMNRKRNLHLIRSRLCGNIVNTRISKKNGMKNSSNCDFVRSHWTKKWNVYFRDSIDKKWIAMHLFTVWFTDEHSSVSCTYCTHCEQIFMVFANFLHLLFLDCFKSFSKLNWLSNFYQLLFWNVQYNGYHSQTSNQVLHYLLDLLIFCVLLPRIDHV